MGRKWEKERKRERETEEKDRERKIKKKGEIERKRKRESERKRKKESVRKRKRKKTNEKEDEKKKKTSTRKNKSKPKKKISIPGIIATHDTPGISLDIPYRVSFSRQRIRTSAPPPPLFMSALSPSCDVTKTALFVVSVVASAAHPSRPSACPRELPTSF